MAAEAKAWDEARVGVLGRLVGELKRGAGWEKRGGEGEKSGGGENEVEMWMEVIAEMETGMEMETETEADREAWTSVPRQMYRFLLYRAWMAHQAALKALEQGVVEERRRLRVRWEREREKLELGLELKLDGGVGVEMVEERSVRGSVVDCRRKGIKSRVCAWVFKLRS